MTKITLTVSLDIPGVDDYSDGELAQLLFDEYINHATCAHLDDVMKWMIQAHKEKQQGKSESSSEMIEKMHRTWADICKNAKWSFVKNEVKNEN